MKEHGGFIARLQTPPTMPAQHLFETEGFQTTEIVTTVRYSKLAGGR